MQTTYGPWSRGSVEQRRDAGAPMRYDRAMSVGGGMDSKGHILVVDDDPDLRDMLQEYFETNGFVVSTAADGTGMRRILAGQPADLVIMDLHLPGEDGLVLTRELRAKGGTGIVMLTGAGETVDRIVGLEMGADDYLAKPVDLRELLARVRSVLRRVQTPVAPAGGEPTNRVAMGTCVLDLDTRRLLNAGGEEVALTAMEFDLLKAFAEHPNRVLSRDQLLDMAHNRDADVFDRSIDVRITRIRKKIEVDPEKPQVLKTIRGAGYMFVRNGK
jgi:two-component system, OmpR family, phosphate regulon response regulator OmpR